MLMLNGYCPVSYTHLDVYKRQTLPNAEKLLMDDSKETAEHATIVDLIRNDLSMVAEQVRVVRYRYCDRLEIRTRPLLHRHID